MNIDIDRMKQVLMNVFLNACQAVEKVTEPHISIRITDKNGFTDIITRDNGGGIKKEHLKDIKKPFFTTRAKGLGLGLAICDKIISLHKGALIIQSDHLSSTEVIISIPAGA